MFANLKVRTQLLLLSREAAITPLQQEIEAPQITYAPGEGPAGRHE